MYFPTAVCILHVCHPIGRCGPVWLFSVELLICWLTISDISDVGDLVI